MSDNSFSKLLNRLSNSGVRVLSPNIEISDYVLLDLSKTNFELQTVDISSSQKLSQFINAYLKHKGAKVAYGGYLEIRDLYKRSTYFNSDSQNTERNIHLGIDLWCNAGTPILAALDGEIHSFKNNTNYGDYGPTIILKHEVSNTTFYTLYGHLSVDSISNIKVGQVVKQGQVIAHLGTSVVNGDYPPHLHFQIIKDIQTYSGDYPGVCNVLHLEFYTANCPDPNLLLKI